MSALAPLEKSLGDVYKSAPALPANGKKALVEWVPIINLVLGVLALLSAYWLWHWAHAVNALTNYVNSYTQALTGQSVVSSRFSVAVWIGIAALAVQGVIMLMAYAPLKAHKKAGWDLLFYSVILNLVYGVATAFSSYGGGHLISSVIGAAIGLYFLYQIRDVYTAK